MRAILLAGLLGSAARVYAHPHTQHKSGLNRRVVDLNDFRLSGKADYVNATVASSDPVVSLMKRESYVDTATDLVKSLVPDATFRVVEDHYVGTNGIAHVNFKQTVHGIDIDNADINVNIAKDGAVFSYGNSFFAGAIPAENPLTKRAFTDPAAALQGATSALNIPVTGVNVTAEATDGTETYVLIGTQGAVSDPKAKLVYFAKDDGTLALTWRVETDIMDNWLLTYVNADTNEEIHGVVDYVADATFQVYAWGLNDPTEGSRTILTDPWDKNASAFGWLNDGTTTYTTTRGNNGIAQSNPSGGTAYLTNYRPTSSSSSFQYTYTTSLTPPSSYIDASITQLFYTANTYHDLLYILGFTEAAGNFQVSNNGKGGTGNDQVILFAQDGSGTNNANFATPVDGQSGRMRMYTWTTATPNRDGSFEAGVVIHEFTHGLSNRLTGGPANSNCLSSTEAGGMGEGWGDFYATAIRLKAGDTRAKDYPLGVWVDNNSAGIRKYPYSTSLTTNPYTYTSVNSLTEVHGIGTVWATILYEVLWNLIDKHGKNDAAKPTFVNGVPTDGKYLAMKLVLDAMALQPCNPNFVQARDAIIDADTALTSGANKCELWTAFAKRGLGSGAKYSSSSRTGSTTIPTGAC